ncbi:hypothetical protein BDW22DRAFT_1420452 [Trametopsis cervina]|nr:hypothetical protein BDW22DRAFT_1420452 [Trametopsis cervina]
MPSSLEPLSSPSPSPSPSPPPPDTRASTSNNSGGGVGLDSGSELSELTEDEQDNVNNKADREENERPSRRGRKRGGIVPAPMWDWAYKNNKKEWKSKMVEEEEEDEQSRPTEVGEEEDEVDQRSRSRSRISPIPERRPKRKSSTSMPVDDEVDEEEVGHVSDIDDEEASADAISVAHRADDTLNDPDYVSDDDERPRPITDDAHETLASVSRGASPEATDDENAEEEDAEPEAGAYPQEEDDGTYGNPTVDSEDEGEDGGDEELPSAPMLANISTPLVPPTASVVANAAKILDSTLTLMDVDTAPVPEQVSPIHAAAAASSIMAGSTVIDPPSPSSSNSSVASPNQSPTSSRSPTPEPLSDRESEVRRGSAKTRAKPKGGRSARTKSRRKAKAEATLDHDADQDQQFGDGEDRDGDNDDPGVDSPEMDVELELQPAHRAEALDVLANIELKYALLRESIYVDKMENLAWEEALVSEGVHPEMLHLHAELSKRRDKRLELASRRRDFEVANATKRRKLDEDGVWSWWKLRRDELQTQMISETNRKRRKLDRERRALDRPQPVRRIPSPPQDLPPAPFIRDIFKSSSLDAPEYRKHQLPESALVYPQLSALSPHDIAQDLDFLLVHRRNSMGFDAARVGMVGFNPILGGHPIPAPLGYEHFGIGIGAGPSDSSGRVSHIPFQQPIPQQGIPGHMIPGYPAQSGPSAPRLTHHHSAPPGALPSAHTQMLLEHDGIHLHRPGSGLPPDVHMIHYPSNMPMNFMRRSISPVPVQAVVTPGGMSLGGVPPSGKTGGRNIAPVIPQSVKDHKRHGSGTRPPDGDGFERERERDRFPDVYKTRDKDDRGREMSNDLHFERERARERDREHDMDRAGYLPHTGQRPPPHPHTPAHLHPSSTQAGATHPPHHHHHHHHHVHHHHHPTNGSNGPGQGPGGPSANVTSLQPSNGPTSRNASPHPHRDIERRGHSGAPVELNELTKKPSSSGPTHPWKNNESSNITGDIHERSRLTGAPSGRERAVPPPSYPSSPRGHGTSTAPASKAPSRRGSWSGADDYGPLHPSAAAAHLNSTLQNPVRIPQTMMNSTTHQQVSPLLPNQRSPAMISPSRHNPVRLPPLSPSLGPNSRSPLRISQPLPGVPGSSTKPISPQLLRRTPPPLGHSESPGISVHPQVGGPPSTQKAHPSSPSIFPAALPHPSLNNPRLSNVAIGAEHTLPPPKVNSLPID